MCEEIFSVESVIVFNATERKEFIEAHIPHRLTALMTPAVRLSQNPAFFQGSGDVYCGCVEGAFSMLRIFIEFLGLASKVENGTYVLVERVRKGAAGKRGIPDTDVMIDNFGLRLVTLADVGADSGFLARIHDGVSKSTSHFTFNTGHGFRPDQDFGRAAFLVLDLLQKHFFQPLGVTPGYHPDLPPFRFA